MSHVHPTAIQIYPWKKITGSNVDLTPPTFFSRNNRIIRGNYVQCSHTGVIRNRTMLSIILDDWDEIDIRSIQPHFWNNLFGTSTTSFFQTLDQWKKKMNVDPIFDEIFLHPSSKRMNLRKQKFPPPFRFREEEDRIFRLDGDILFVESESFSEIMARDRSILTATTRDYYISWKI